ncbi:MAG: hypothetical protein NTZ04_06000 [Chloroflexi bacterium]|nr:hypothetical protein [Chloroflexota bacterium]
MDEQSRKTGIDIIGDVPWGTHFCHFYRTKHELINVLVPDGKTRWANGRGRATE